MLLLPPLQHVSQYFSSPHPILRAASGHFKTLLVAGLLEVCLMAAKGDEYMTLKMVGLFQSMEATVLV